MKATENDILSYIVIVSLSMILAIIITYGIIILSTELLGDNIAQIVLSTLGMFGWYYSGFIAGRKHQNNKWKKRQKNLKSN